MQFSNSLFGYNKVQVDQALKEKDNQISTLQQQVQEIQTQLVQYIEMEQALKDGIVDARMTGNKIVEESSVEAERILQRTNEQVEQYQEEFAEHSHELVDSGLHIRDALKDMKNEMLDIIENYRELLDNTDFDALYPEEQVVRFKHQVQDYEEFDMTTKKEPKKKMWDSTSMTDEEKKELEKLIHEVIANEKPEEKPIAESKLVQFAKNS
ncbi:DivIVA domain-containing protein [Tuanshanicoccus lijuaniae]|uniref:DivIVA domain-containing protein n=1 Tax=Aerococcaceae bacterium zg-1292 TaxID=2774330 RepID=UPI0019369B0A|nr:DivIVA domain-containing protein [Aerococcaceae bacterium zg-1292]QQA36809.1 DivIVA domain-containing protein [Aerococcaceae bacterium zg-1292]